MKIVNFGIEEWLNKWGKEAVYDIVQSLIKALTLDEFVDLDGTSVSEFLEKRKNEPLDYGWIEGSDVFKQEVVSPYQITNSENILQTNEAIGANFLALYTLVEAGDHAIPMFSIYQQLYDIPESLGAAVDLVHLREREDWQFDLEQLEALVRPETKIICLNSVSNPTGALLDRRTLGKVAEVARVVDIYVLMDEVYASLTDEGELSSIVDTYEKGIATNSLSRTYSIPGIRTDWTATGPELVEVSREYRDYTMVCDGILSDDLAVHALKNKEKILGRNKRIITENLVILEQWVANEPKVELTAPNYASTLFIKLAIEEDGQTSHINLLEETRVLLAPGSAFNLPKHIRLGYCCRKEVLEKGLFLLSEFLKRQA